MICPHCSRNVKRKERTGNVCGSCKRRFALEPKENFLNLHDVRMTKLATKLSDNGTYRFTTTQLWYAASHKAIARRARFPAPGKLFLSAIAVVVLTVLGFVAEAPLYWVFAAVLALGWALYLTARHANRYNRRILPPVTHPEFVNNLLDSWRRTYGGDVPGVVREAGAPPEWHVPQPVLAVLSDSHPALVALFANDVHRRHNVALVHRPDRVPAGVPVVLLHDVSLDGYRFAAEARAALGSRVVADLTPRPSVVKAAKGAVKLRQPAPRAEALRWPVANGVLAEADVAWLAEGWWSPVAALRPSALIGRVATAVQRAADPERRTAAAIGFLTWPGA
jgi:hypothetical protein